LAHKHHDSAGVTGIALSAALGLGIGFIGGIFLRGLVSGLDTEPVRNAVRNLRKSAASDVPDLEEIERTVLDALEDDPDTRELQIAVEALGDGIVELTGTTRDPLSRQIAADIARSVPGADIVVNRILVEGGDGAPTASPPQSEAG